MEVPVSVFTSALLAVALSAYGWLVKKVFDNEKASTSGNKDFLTRLNEQEKRMMEIEYNYKERFSRLELQQEKTNNLIMSENKDTRHTTANAIQKIQGGQERVMDILERIEQRFDEQDKRIEKFYEKNPELKKV